MSKKFSFTPVQRFVVFTLHGEQCYLCSIPLDLASMQVDHIIPESLSRDLAEFRRVRETLGLPEEFDINQYENWLPSCSHCNRLKGEIVFMASPIVQVQLQRAAAKASRAREMEASAVRRGAVLKALNTIERATSDGVLSADDMGRLRELVTLAGPYRVRRRMSHPMRLTPTYEEGHRIIHVDDDQEHATCVNSRGDIYRISLKGALPDVNDRATQIEILGLLRRALAVDSIWDHFDGINWHVSVKRTSDGAVIELSCDQDHVRAILYAFFRVPVNVPNSELAVKTAEIEIGRLVELTHSDQPTSPYCFLERSEAVVSLCTPLGAMTIDAAISLLGDTKIDIG